MVRLPSRYLQTHTWPYITYSYVHTYTRSMYEQSMYVGAEKANAENDIMRNFENYTLHLT